MMVAMFSLNWRMVLVVMLIYQRYSTPIARRVRSYLADINNGFNEVIGGMSVIQLFRQQARFGERMDAAPQRYGPDQRPLASGCLTLNNLSFAYRENRDVLSDINLEVPSRSFVALVDLPQVMILDEATANIDSGTEQAIQQTLRTLRQHSTLVVIAHRFSTITEADTILVLHRGRVVEQGNHAQLLALQGRYWQMYQIQQVGDDLATGIPLTSEE